MEINILLTQTYSVNKIRFKIFPNIRLIKVAFSLFSSNFIEISEYRTLSMMSKKELRRDILELLKKIHSTKGIKVKQQDIASAINQSSSTISKIKSEIEYDSVSIKTLKTIRLNLTQLYKEYKLNLDRFTPKNVRNIVIKPNLIGEKINKWHLFIYSLFIFLVGFSVAYLWVSEQPIFTSNQDTYYFLDSFLIEDVNTLLENDWEILDPNQRYLDTLSYIRNKEDYLTLFTLDGDYWDSWGGWSHMLKIKNLFVHKIECECCIITTKIDSFFPTEKHQQAGLILFDDLDKKNFVRITYKYYEKESDHPATPWVQVVQMKNKKMTDLGGFWFDRINLNSAIPHKSIALKVEVSEDKIAISYNLNSKAFNYSFELDRFLDINYVGLAAFQGNGLNASIIPVRFDFIEVAGCDSEF